MGNPRRLNPLQRPRARPYHRVAISMGMGLVESACVRAYLLDKRLKIAQAMSGEASATAAPIAPRLWDFSFVVQLAEIAHGQECESRILFYALIPSSRGLGEVSRRASAAVTGDDEISFATTAIAAQMIAALANNTVSSANQIVLESSVPLFFARCVLSSAPANTAPELELNMRHPRLAAINPRVIDIFKNVNQGSIYIVFCRLYPVATPWRGCGSSRASATMVVRVAGSLSRPILIFTVV